MLSHNITLTESATLAVWHVTESADELESALSHPELYAAKVATLKPGSRRRQEIVAVRRLLKEMSDGHEWDIRYTAEGSPFRADGDASVSISHTEGQVAALVVRAPGGNMPKDLRPYVHPGVRPGVDIERLGHRVARVAPRFLTPEELGLLSAAEGRFDAMTATIGGSIDPITLHLAWSAKESAYKVLGSAYYDLQHKVQIVGIEAKDNSTEWLSEGHITMRAEGIKRPLDIRFGVTSEYVLTYTLWA